MSKKREIRLFISDIKEATEAIFEYVKGIDFEVFVNDRKTHSAVIREFEIIGEAVKNLPDDIKDRHDEIIWRDIVDFRNLLIHAYFGVDFDIIWNTIKEDLPKLYEVILKIERDLRC